MIKTIFFDFDGVLTTDSNGSGRICRNLQKVLPDISFEELYRCYRAHHSLLLVGKATHADIWNDFCRCVGKEIDIGLLPTALSVAPKNEPMLDLCRALHGKYRTGIITDNTKERFELLVPALDLDTLFDFILLSADVGTRKDNPAIFEKALQAAECTADDCIYIDNQERNLTIPAEMGFHTFWHDDEKNDMHALLSFFRMMEVRIV